MQPVDLTGLAILPFQPQDQPAVQSLVLAGMAEHWGRLDPTKNPDLNDIATSYAQATFLVARLEGRIVGCGALIPRSQDIAEIVRMSVAKDLRRSGLGRQILEALLYRARQDGYRRVILETTAAWSEVIAFYQSCGFHITQYQGEDVYFALDLNA